MKHRDVSAKVAESIKQLMLAKKFEMVELKASQLVAEFPASGFAWKMLGFSQAAQNKDAELAIEKAVSLIPNDPALRCTLGIILRTKGKVYEAINCFEVSLKLKKDYSEAHCNLGIAQIQIWDIEAACRNLEAALKIKPDYIDAINNLGLVLTELGRYEDALAILNKGISINPNNPEVMNNRANALKALCHYDEAAKSYEIAISKKKNYTIAINNLGNLYKDIGMLVEAVDCYRTALEIEPRRFDIYSNLLFCRNYLSNESKDVLFQEAKRFGKLISQEYLKSENLSSIFPLGKIKVGFVSADLYSHPVGYFFESVLESLVGLSADVFDIYVYCCNKNEDELTIRLRSNDVCFRKVFGLTDFDLSRIIRDDGINVLIDLSGHTAGNRLAVFAMRSATIQISWLGYFATTGMREMDYLIADDMSLPREEEQYYTEKILRLERTRLCFTPPKTSPHVSESPAVENGFVTFGCFNNISKVNSDVIRVWSAIVNGAKGSKLLLKSKQLSSSLVISRIRSEFEKYSIYEDRLRLEGGTSRFDYLSKYSQIDIALDPFPFTGGTTTIEGLWMGVPLVTLSGESMVSRQGVMMLACMGLEEWITVNQDDYISKAIKYSLDIPKLNLLREGLRERLLKSDLCDSVKFARNLKDTIMTLL